MKQIEEKWKNKKNLFDNHGPLCFVHLFVKSQLTFLQVKTSVYCHHHRQLLNIRSLGERGEKQNLLWECKTTFGRVLKPTIYIYTDMHILFSVYLGN